MNKLGSQRIKQMLENMKYCLFVCCKCLVGEKSSIIAFWKLTYTTIGCVSSIFAFSVLLKDLVGCDKVEDFCKDRWYMLIVIGLAVALVIHHQKISCKGIIENDDLQIIVKVKDMFCIDACSYVIPTNTFFRTIMDGDYISPQSVQGAFQIKYFRKDISKLDRLIEKSLEQQGIKGEESSDIHGNVKKYPVGTTAKIDYKDRHYYFLAISDVNRYGKPENQSYNNVDLAMKGLFETIKKIGHCDDICMPLIGTGRAAIREATIEKVIQETVDRFIMTEDKIARKLIVCLRPKDFIDGKVNLKKIEKYVGFRCEFKESLRKMKYPIIDVMSKH